VRLLLGLWTLLATLPATAEDLWVLEIGPEAVESIPLVPVQPVPSWRGAYGDGVDRFWVYVTASPQFFPPALPQVRRLAGTPWTAVAFFPSAWKTKDQIAWFDSWVVEFRSLQSLPQPGWPIVLPSVLRKG